MEYVTVSEASKRLQVSERTVWSYIKQGKLKYKREKTSKKRFKALVQIADNLESETETSVKDSVKVIEYLQAHLSALENQLMEKDKQIAQKDKQLDQQQQLMAGQQKQLLLLEGVSKDIEKPKGIIRRFINKLFM